MHEAAATCKDIARAAVTNGLLPRYNVTERGNVTVCTDRNT